MVLQQERSISGLTYTLLMIRHDTHRSRSASRLLDVRLDGAFEGHASGEDGDPVRLGAFPGDAGAGVAVDAPRLEAGAPVVGRGFDVQGSGGRQDQRGSLGRGSGGSVPVPRSRGAVSGSEAGHGRPRWKPAKRRQKDLDAKWTRKGSKSLFGYKRHVVVDVGHKRARSELLLEHVVNNMRHLVHLAEAESTPT